MTPATDIHHLWWPRDLYRTKKEKEFRELPCMKVGLSYHAHHSLLHTHQEPPRKPSAKVIDAELARHHRRECVICFPKG